jgi:hypothetical protein
MNLAIMQNNSFMTPGQSAGQTPVGLASTVILGARSYRTTDRKIILQTLEL